MRRLGVLIALLLVLHGCAAGRGAAPATDADASDGGDVGEPLVVRAATSQAGFVFPGDEVTLTGSMDEAGEGVSAVVVQWVQTAGEPVTLTGDDPFVQQFVVPDDALPGETLGFEFRAIGSDGNEGSEAVYMFVPRGPAVLLALASGPIEPVVPGDTVTMRSIGSLNIPPESASYLWEIIEGPEMDVTGADSPTGTFTAPETDEELTLRIRLTLENNGLTASDEAEVVVTPVSQ